MKHCYIHVHDHISRASKRMRESVSGSPTHLLLTPPVLIFGRGRDVESCGCWNAGEGKAGSESSAQLQMPVH